MAFACIEGVLKNGLSIAEKIYSDFDKEFFSLFFTPVTLLCE